MLLNPCNRHAFNTNWKLMNLNVRKRTLRHVRAKIHKSTCESSVKSESSFSTRRKLAFLAIQNAPWEDSDQTARMRSLIWIFAGRSCQKVRFLMMPLEWCYTAIKEALCCMQTTDPRPACASTHSDQGLRYPRTGSMDTVECVEAELKHCSECTDAQAVRAFPVRIWHTGTFFALHVKMWLKTNGCNSNTF